MRRHRRTRAGLVLVLASLAAGGVAQAQLPPASSSAAQPAAPGGQAKTADELTLEARDLALKPETLPRARELLLTAWGMKKSYDIAGNLGAVEYQLAMYRDAAEHLSYCKQNYPAVRDAEQTAKLARVEGLLAKVKAEVGSARIRVTGADGAEIQGAEVLIDDRSIGRTPFADEVFVTPGTRTIKARFPGYMEGSRQIQSVKGRAEPEPVVLMLVPAQSGYQGGGGYTSRPAKKSTAIIVAGAGLAAVGLGVGVGFHLASNSKSAESLQMWLDLKDTGGRGACLNAAFQKDCDVYLATYKDEKIFQGLAIGGYVGGGVLAVATLVYALGPWPSRSSASKGSGSPSVPAPEVRAAFGIVPGGGGATLVGTF